MSHDHEAEYWEWFNRFFYQPTPEINQILSDALDIHNSGLGASLSTPTKSIIEVIRSHISWDEATSEQILADLRYYARWRPSVRYDGPVRSFEDQQIIDRLNESLRSGQWMKR